MLTPNQHHGWLSLVEVSGPFLAVPVLREVFPQGLEELETSRARRLRSAYEEWREAVDGQDADVGHLHRAWIDEVLRTALEVDESILRSGDRVPTSASTELPEHDTKIVPDVVLIDPTHGDALLTVVHVFEPDTDLSASMKFGGLSCSPADRMALQLRALGKPFGLVTNGEQWMLVHAPVAKVATFASWYARLWGQEPQTLRAFVSLLSVRRFFARDQDQLPSLFERSLKHQDEVTDALGGQVRRAIEVLVQALDRSDQDRNRELLRDVRPQELYEAGLTVMMRLVFLLAAEERGLLLLGEPRYDSFYAASTLRMQLRAESDEILERRHAAWSRLLAVFRAVYGGIDHPTLRLPAMGGSLFDPDRFPFLEGRLKGTSWQQHRAEPLPIDDRTVLLLLEAIQTFEGHTLSYRALDVEQIGHVYEGLLERTVARVEDVTLELEAGAQAKDARMTLGELESARFDGQASIVSLLVERSKRSEPAIRKTLALGIEPQQSAHLLSACRGDVALRDRLEPYVRLLRTDPWGYPLVHPKGAFVVVLGADRRETGTHYTPKSLTEKIVEETLTPLVYDGPSRGTPRGEWKLKTSTELLDLKVCDPAMGSGAFLVQACRFISARLVEAWVLEEATGRVVDIEGHVHASSNGFEPLPSGVEARAEQARCLVAERCLYGVDLNPLAVELAKLSLWLVTLSKGRPFGFLDHNLRCGDSLLGIHRLDHLTELSMVPTGQGQLLLFGQNVERAVREAIELRSRLREMPIRDIRDVEAMTLLDTDARSSLEVSECIADAFIGEVLASEGNGSALEGALASLTVQAGQVIDGDRGVLPWMRRRSVAALSTDLPAEKPARRPFHWPLEYPEVFPKGFDAVIGNPPFVKGTAIGKALGACYRTHVGSSIGKGIKASYADLCAFFLLRALSLVRQHGGVGLVATNTISQGDTREMGLDQVIAEGSRPYWVKTDVPWSGSASVVVTLLAIRKNDGWLDRRLLNDERVDNITQFLTEGAADIFHPQRLMQNSTIAFKGSTTGCKGFVLDATEAKSIIASDQKYAEVIQPFIGGQDFNSSPTMTTDRWVINFRDWNYERASQYPLCLEILRARVKPYFDSRTGQIHEKDFWKFSDKRLDSYKSIAQLKRVLFHAFTSKHLAFGFVGSDLIYSAPHVVVALQGYDHFAVLQSSFHLLWVVEICSTMGVGIRYAPSDLLETFPFPDGLIGHSHREVHNDLLDDLGSKYYAARSLYMTEYGIGLTDFYNQFHDANQQGEEISHIRRIHSMIDQELCGHYSLKLNLDHRFVNTKIGVRYLPAKENHSIVVLRIAELNRQRYEKEVAEGLHGDGMTRASVSTARAGRVTSAVSAQPELNFNAGTIATISGSTPTSTVLGFLSAHGGWHAKADILIATGITDGQWNATIAGLIADGRVERQGERRGARYRFLAGEEE
jgi:hypothetical protein